MMKSRWLALLAVLALAVFAAGCAIEEPYPGWTPTPDPSPPLSMQDVITLFHVGIGEDAILSKVRWNGIAARPSVAEIQALRNAGADEGFIAGLLAAPIPYLHDVPADVPWPERIEP